MSCKPSTTECAPSKRRLVFVVWVGYHKPPPAPCVPERSRRIRGCLEKSPSQQDPETVTAYSATITKATKQMPSPLNPARAIPFVTSVQTSRSNTPLPHLRLHLLEPRRHFEMRPIHRLRREARSGRLRLHQNCGRCLCLRRILIRVWAWVLAYGLRIASPVRRRIPTFRLSRHGLCMWCCRICRSSRCIRVRTH